MNHGGVCRAAPGFAGSAKYVTITTVTTATVTTVTITSVTI